MNATPLAVALIGVYVVAAVTLISGPPPDPTATIRAYVSQLR